MDRKAYKAFHEMFVSNSKGTTMLEISTISLICPLSVLIMVKVDKFLGNTSSLLRLFIEFLILATPLLIVFTETISSFDTVFALAFVTAFINLIESPQEKEVSAKNERKLSFLTNYRASMLLVTSICILAVDFRTYPRRFAKTEEVGFGLMDIGVGSFIFSAGTVSPTSKDKIVHNLKKSMPLLILGIGKYVSAKLVDYHSHVTEYGLHWNFFITMALIQMICGTMTSTMGKKWVIFSALVVSIGYEYYLSSQSIYQWVFSITESKRLRSGFVIANIEGVLSLFGYAALFLSGSVLRSSIYNLLKPKHWKRFALINIVLWNIYVIVINEGFLSLPSRRLCNLTYVIWMVAYNQMLLVLFSGIQLLTDSTSTTWTYKCIAGCALPFFLVANVLTGLVNVTFQPALLPDKYARPILALYTFALCVLSGIYGKLMKIQ